jgi:L,D-peptidoglycan transpeptidase YkuD (ErfK/YbiS/YcfS/YnhG family)
VLKARARFGAGIRAASRTGARTGSARGRLRAALVAAVLALGVTSGGSSALAETFWSPGTGTHWVGGAILERYQALGGPQGLHGHPITDELSTPNGRGRYNHFWAGSIYWTPYTGAHSVHGYIHQRWGQLGWENGPLGFPTTDEFGTPDGRGRYNHFEFGSIYWTPTTGAHGVYGYIRDRWAAMGWERSRLGFPTTDELATANLQGRFNHFEGGSVYWSPASGSHSVYGAIQERWGQMGWENSALGFPTSDEYDIPGGRAQDFQYGSIGWTPAGGTFLRGTMRAVLGPMRAYVGSSGIGVANEGRQTTPAGTWRLAEAFGRAGNPGTALPYRRVDGDDWWVSDVRSPLYNQYAQCAPRTCPFDERVSENLFATGGVYDLAVVIDYNRPVAMPSAGSAFFLHIANNRPTAGCVAVARGDLEALMRWLHPGANPVMSIGLG